MIVIAEAKSQVPGQQRGAAIGGGDRGGEVRGRIGVAWFPGDIAPDPTRHNRVLLYQDGVREYLQAIDLHLRASVAATYDYDGPQPWWSIPSTSPSSSSAWTATEAADHWIGATTNGLPIFRGTLATRIAYEMAHGRQVPAGRHVRRRCSAPLCVRAEHLTVDADEHVKRPAPR